MKKLLFILVSATIILASCTKNNSNDGIGRLSVKITDDPFDINFVESATVTITKIEIRKTGDDTGNPFMIISETPVIVDLINLRNGITQELVNLEVPNGDYDLVRLYVDEAGLKIKDQADPYRLKVPSGQQTGIKVFIEPSIHVEGGLTAELLLDFDLSKSFVMRGNMNNAAGVNGFIFKPCVRASNISTTGRIEGYIKDIASDPIPDAKVLIEQNEFSATAYADATGHYALMGIPAGSYTVSASQTGYETAIAEDIMVVPANRTLQDFTLINTLSYVSSVIEDSAPDILVMTYNLALANIVPDLSAFTVIVNSSPMSVIEISIDGTSVLLKLASPVENGDVVTVAYTKPETNMLQTVEVYPAASFTAKNVTNNVAP